MFTADEFADGSNTVLSTLAKQKIKASFFFTGNFLRNKKFNSTINKFRRQGHYIGPHSNKHLLYCDWNNRDSLLVTKQQFVDDLKANLNALGKHGIAENKVPYFIPSYEWYNDSIALWTKQLGMQLINFSPGTLATADYTWSELKNYRSSELIYQSIMEKEEKDPNGLNGFILLVHFGTDPRRTDKFYNKLDALVTELKNKGYSFVSLEEMLN